VWQLSMSVILLDVEISSTPETRPGDHPGFTGLPSRLVIVMRASKAFLR
jgi:hypothetical protein